LPFLSWLTPESKYQGEVYSASRLSPDRPRRRVLAQFAGAEPLARRTVPPHLEPLATNAG